MTEEQIKNIGFEELLDLGSFACDCGKVHEQGVKKVVIESGAIRRLPEMLREIGAEKPFLLSGHDTFAAAGKAVCDALAAEEIPYSQYVFPVSPVKPTEYTVGSALMHFDYSCDAIVGIGSGVINDTGKMLARATGMKYIIVATAPSMDGFVSATSSMDRDGLRVSLNSTAAWGVIGDLDILCNAPMHMLLSGVGDMLAKITSIAEWEIAALLVQEYYCPVIAALVKKALARVTDNTDGLLRREPEAVRAVMEGLVIAGIAMNYAGMSRPASGTEHYFSHIWDMRSLAFEEARAELHGIQAGIGTLYTLKVFDLIRNGTIKPDAARAEKYVRGFDKESWNAQLRSFVGPGAEAMIAGEEKEHKYDLKKHAERYPVIEQNWDRIREIVSELPESGALEKLMRSIGFPVSAEVIGYSPENVKTTFTMTKDIRDKYIVTRLLWDLGALDAVDFTGETGYEIP